MDSPAPARIAHALFVVGVVDGMDVEQTQSGGDGRVGRELADSTATAYGRPACKEPASRKDRLRRNDQFTPDATIPAGLGLFDVHTVYDTDDKQRMGNAVLAAGESIPGVPGQPTSRVS